MMKLSTFLALILGLATVVGTNTEKGYAVSVEKNI